MWTLAAAGVAAAIAVSGAAAYARFSDSGTSAAAVSTGLVQLDFAGTSSSPLTLPVASVRPGDSRQRLVDLVNAGSLPVSRLQIETVMSPSADASDGLQYILDSCSKAWVASGGGFTCPGTTRSITTQRPVAGRVELPTSPARAAGASDHLRFTFVLPTSAPASQQGLTQNVRVSAAGQYASGRQK